MSAQAENVTWNQVGIRSVLTREEIAATNQRRDLPGILFFCGHFAMMILTGYLFHLSIDSWWAIPFCFLHGVVIVYWFQPFHECSHKTAYKTPWMNSFVYWFSALVSILEPTHFYFEHMQHHRYTQQPDIDPERIPQADNLFGYLLYLTALPYFFYQIKGLLSHFFGYISEFEQGFIPEKKRARVIFESRVIVAFYAVLFVGSLLMQSWFLFIFWLLPRVAGEPLMRVVRLSEHQGCPLVPDLFRNTRTVVAMLPLKYLGWYACYHAEHHISPNTPFHAVPTLHKKIAHKIEQVNGGYLPAHKRIFSAVVAGKLPRCS